MFNKKSQILRLPVLLLLCLAFLIGCGKEDKTDRGESNKDSYNIESINGGQLGNIIRERSGKVLFINVWATWCVPCVEEFPDIVRTAEYYKDLDVDFVSLNVDFGEKKDSLLTDFLKKFKADFKVYNVEEKSSEEVINLLNSEWSGDIPATFIFDRRGKLADFISGAETFSAFRSRIDSVRNL